MQSHSSQFQRLTEVTSLHSMKNGITVPSQSSQFQLLTEVTSLGLTVPSQSSQYERLTELGHQSSQYEGQNNGCHHSLYSKD